MPTLAEELQSDSSGDIAIAVFEQRVLDYAHDMPDYPMANECTALLDWTFDFFSRDPAWEDWYEVPLSFKDARDRALKALSEKDIAAAEGILRRARPKPKGRPSKWKVATVKVFIYKTLLGWKWPVLTSHFCPCGKSKHNASCRLMLRKTMERLQRQLKEYQVTFAADKMEESRQFHSGE